MRALFLHDDDDLSATIAGGVQLCTREFLAIVQAASERTETLAVQRSRAAADRVLRRAHLSAYRLYRPQEYATRLDDALRSLDATHVFLNRAELLRFSPLLRHLKPAVQVVVMSHGNQSGDDLYEIAGPLGRRTGLARFTATWQLGLDLVTESWHRHRHVDGVCAMSQEEAVIERWLGARRTLVLPRLVEPAPLDWRPIANRAGYVGTLDHTPNRAALTSLCEELRAAGRPPELRVVGGPESVGREFATKYSFVTYVGRLPDADLAAEVASWSVFLNPIFWLARGASMKLRQGLAWGVPVLTTESGRRGYEWRDGDVPTTADQPAVFASRLLALLGSADNLKAAHAASLAAAGTAPTARQLANRLAGWSDSLPS